MCAGGNLKGDREQKNNEIFVGQNLKVYTVVYICYIKPYHVSSYTIRIQFIHYDLEN